MRSTLLLLMCVSGIYGGIGADRFLGREQVEMADGHGSSGAYHGVYGEKDLSIMFHTSIETSYKISI